jgi:hypothetical protein
MAVKGKSAPVKSKSVPAKGKSAPVKPLSEAPAEPKNINDVPDLVDSGFIDLCDRYRELSDRIAEMEKEKKELAGVIMPLMEATGCDSVRSDRWTAIRARGTSSKIVPELLLKYGVTMTTIEKSTKTSHYFYVQVRNVPQ